MDFSYENLPELCSFCHVVGHSVGVCRRAKAAAANSPDPQDHQGHNTTENRDKDKGKGIALDAAMSKPARKQWVAKDAHQSVVPKATTEQQPAVKNSSSSAIVLANKYTALQETVGDLEKLASLSPFDKLELITIPASPGHDEVDHEGSTPAKVDDLPPPRVVFTDPVISHISSSPPQAHASPISNEFTEENAMRLALKVAKMAGKSADEVLSLDKRPTSLTDPPSKGSDLVQTSLIDAYKRGATPTAYSLEPGEHTSVMSKVASHRWSDEVDDHIATTGPLDPP